MRYFDLHCDTLYRAINEGKTLDEPKFHLSISKGKRFEQWVQCMAVWVPDDITDEAAWQLFNDAYNKLINEAKTESVKLCTTAEDVKSEKTTFIFTLENAKAIGNDIAKIATLARCGVKIVTLTWNAENAIGGGSQAQDIGLKPFGRLAVAEFEKQGVVCDISHASDKLFWDVAKVAQKPIIATHSNSRRITPHMRNLTDEQFLYLANNKGLVGLNFAQIFLNENPDKSAICDIIKHAEHFLSLNSAAEDVLCIGSDFDGADMPKGIIGIESIPDLYEDFFKANYSESLLEKIFLKNARNFFANL
ncbi:MAG: dipeptidase [Oscillospiraceae bacterium]|jgi:membrane dipeptidase|nr:dipeptidase [Oscillospiraceae bacterium]